MRTIYAVGQGQYDWSIICCFEKKEDAEAYIVALMEADAAMEHPSYSKWDKPWITQYQLWDRVPAIRVSQYGDLEEVMP